MGSIAKYIDLSREIPGPRAFVDVRLKGLDRRKVFGPGIKSGADSELPGPPDLALSWDDRAEWTSLEDFE
jgi:hypothetical protein